MLGNQLVDLRSDTVSRPTPEMRAAMARAEVGDDVYGEDPTVNRLEALAAERLGKEAAVFVSSGTQGNLVALLAHCQRGDEYLVGHAMHSYRSEAGGAAVLGGIQPEPLELAADGTLPLAAIAGAIKPDDIHYPRSRLLCLENTVAGRPIPTDYIVAATALAHERGLRVHLDGARIFNAAHALGTPAAAIAAPVDSVTFCLSKGLGAPVGSVLCGSRAFAGEARRLRKLLGGGMRQAGILAAAGIHALEHHVERLGEDHANAARLAQALAGVVGGVDGFRLDPDSPRTNMVYLSVDDAPRAELVAFLAERGILVSARNPIRLVTHLDVSRADVERVVEAVGDFLAGGPGPARRQ